MPRVGAKRKKTRTEKVEDEGEKEKKTTPRCFVMKRGTVGQLVQDLVMDFRNVMSPNSAKNLRESRTNRIADFTAVASGLGVTHLCLFSTTKMGTYLRVARLPQGPTLTFKVLHFSLARDIRASQKRPHNSAPDFLKAPLQVLNGFSGQGGKKSNEQILAYEMLSGLFPSLDVANFRHSECKRVALFNQDRATGIIQFRHYSIVRKTAGIQRGVSKLLRTSRVSSMGKMDDISDFVFSGGGAASESEMEDAVDVPSLEMGGDSSSIAIKLREIGPRMELQLIKGEEGLMNGMVLFHRYLTKTPSEQEVLAKKAKEKKKLKERNEKIENVVDSQNKKKKKAKEKEKEKKRKDRDANDDFGDPDAMKPKGEGKGGEKRNRTAKSFWGKRKSEGGGEGGNTMRDKVMGRFKSSADSASKKQRKG